MDPLQFLGETGSKNDVTFSIFLEGRQRERCNRYNFYLVSNRNDVTITFCGNDAHLFRKHVQNIIPVHVQYFDERNEINTGRKFTIFFSTMQYNSARH
jgi:hypothetical protein